MKNQLALKKADDIEDQQHVLAVQNGSDRITKLLVDLGPKIAIADKRMVIAEAVTPEEAMAVMFRLKHEMDAGGTALKFLRLWQGDFCSAFAAQMGIPMNKAANELSEVFGEKPKRILRLVNTSERSPKEFRDADVDYTVLQELADLPLDKDPEVQAKTEAAKKLIIQGVSEEGKDRKWMKETLATIKKASGILDAEETKPQVTLESILVQHYNLAKFFAECADADECQRIEDSMKALEPSIENLANARGHKLYFEMESAPLVEGLAEEADIDEII